MCGTVTSHASGLPVDHGRIVVPSGHLPSWRIKPTGLTAWIGTSQSSPDNVIRVALALLSWCTSLTCQAMEASCVDCLAASAFMWFTLCSQVCGQLQFWLPHQSDAEQLIWWVFQRTSCLSGDDAASSLALSMSTVACDRITVLWSLPTCLSKAWCVQNQQQVFYFLTGII